MNTPLPGPTNEQPNDSTLHPQPEENGETSTKKEIRLVDIEITNENVALNVIVSFLSLAQSRGSFNIEESSKIWQCINIFKNKGS